jgi:hypothetical protein
MRAVLVLIALAVVACAVACFSVGTFADGTIHCSTDPARPCPSGSACVQGFCFHVAPDLGVGDLAGAVAGD